ncbi:MAG: Hsp70 family protein [Armatimonadota bacterium]|nr:Hsp70 family protein [Armatimonadota bacterium]
MTGKIGLDFGTSNTVVAVWNGFEGEAYHMPDYGRFYTPDPNHPPTPSIPSLIHYDAQRQWIGNQVLQQNLYESPRTFRWMKRYIAQRSQRTLQLNGRTISAADAGRDFLTAVLIALRTELELDPETEIACCTPIEAFEHYENWLLDTVRATGFERIRLIDEPSAAALGYGISLHPNEVYMVFDFGGGTLDVSIVLVEPAEQAALGHRCRVLGKAGAELGGATIDAWLYQEVLRRNQREAHEESIRGISRLLLTECERVKEQLSFRERAALSVMHPRTGEVLEAEFTRAEFEALLDAHQMYTQIHRTIQRALNDAYERGYPESMIRAVLMVGGSCLIPSVQQTVQRRFGRERVYLQRPLDAVARGAAAFVAGVDFYDFIQHDYAIRHRNMRTGEYEYLVIVPRGTPYPTREPIRRLVIKATYTGQTQMGVDIFELSDIARNPTSTVELVFDPSGAARVMPVSEAQHHERMMFWMNEHAPTFLHADPPAQRGEPCFEVMFGIDSNKRLLITVRDLRTMRLVLQDHPVVKLD